MISKIHRLIDGLLKIKFLVVRNISKRFLRKAIYIVFFPFLKFLINTRLGRDLLYSSLPKNELLIGNTDEGLHYVINSSDEVIGRVVFRDKVSFDSQHLLTALHLIKKKKKTLIDVGANIGTIGISAISKGLFDKCIAFEPEPANFKLLQTNINLNGLRDKIDARNEALSNELGGSIDFELSETNHGDHRVRMSNKPGFLQEEQRKVISVKVNTLDSVLENYNLSECLVFMDTQGFEGHVLSGARSLIKESVPIVTEFWPYGLLRAGGFELFCSVLADAEYTTIYDLRRPNEKLEFSIGAVKKIADELGDEGESTDIVFLRE